MGSCFTMRTDCRAQCARGTHQGMVLSSQWVKVPPGVLSLSLEVQGLFHGLILGWLLGVCPSVVSETHR